MATKKELEERLEVLTDKYAQLKQRWDQRDDICVEDAHREVAELQGGLTACGSDERKAKTFLLSRWGPRELKDMARTQPVRYSVLLDAVRACAARLGIEDAWKNMPVPLDLEDLCDWESANPGEKWCQRPLELG